MPSPQRKRFWAVTRDGDPLGYVKARLKAEALAAAEAEYGAGVKVHLWEGVL